MDLRIFGVARDEENAGSRSILDDLGGQGAAAHAGHHHVADEQVDGGGVGSEEGESGFAGVGFDNLKATAFEDFPDEGPNAFFVVDNEDALGGTDRGGIGGKVKLEAGAFRRGKNAPGDAGLAQQGRDGREGAVRLAGRWTEQFEVFPESAGEAVDQQNGGELRFELEGPLGVAGEGEEDLFELASVGCDGEVGGLGPDGKEGLAGGEAPQEGSEIK